MKRKLGELLIEAGAASAGDVESALADQAAGEPSRLGDLLLSMGKITPTALARALAVQHDLPFCDLSYVAPEASGLIPIEFQRAHKLVPFRVDRESGATRVHVAFADPTLIELVDELRSQLKHQVVVHVAPIDDIESVHSALSGESGEEPVVMGEVLDDDLFLAAEPAVASAEAAFAAADPFASLGDPFDFPAPSSDSSSQGLPPTDPAAGSFDFGGPPADGSSDSTGAATDQFDFAPPAEPSSAASASPGAATDAFDLAAAELLAGSSAGAAASTAAVDSFDFAGPPAGSSTGSTPATATADPFDFAGPPADPASDPFAFAAPVPIVEPASVKPANTDPRPGARPPRASPSAPRRPVPPVVAPVPEAPIPTADSPELFPSIVEPPPAPESTAASVTEEELFGSLDLQTPAEVAPLSTALADEIGRHDLAPPQQETAGFSSLSQPLGDPGGALASSPFPIEDSVPLKAERPLTAPPSAPEPPEPVIEAEVEPLLEADVVPAPLLSPMLDLPEPDAPKIPSFAISPEVPVEPRRSPVAPLRRPAALGRIALKRVAVSKEGVVLDAAPVAAPELELPEWMRGPAMPIAAVTSLAAVEPGELSLKLVALLARVERGAIPPGPVVASLVRLLIERRFLDDAAVTAELEKL